MNSGNLFKKLILFGFLGFVFFASGVLLYDSHAPLHASKKLYKDYIVEPLAQVIYTTNIDTKLVTGLDGLSLSANLLSAQASGVGENLRCFFDVLIFWKSTPEYCQENAVPTPSIPTSEPIPPTTFIPTEIPKEEPVVTVTDSPIRIISSSGSVGAVGPMGPGGSTGPQGPQGIQGLRGPKGESADVDTSDFVTRDFLAGQVNRIYDSVSDNIGNLENSLAEEVSTGTLTVAGNSTLSGNLAIAGDLTEIKNLNYSWPSAHVTSGVLQNDGTGALTWATLGAAAVTPDSLNFSEFLDALTLDDSTDIGVDNAEVFSITNTGTGHSFLVSDEAGDTTPFVIDASGNVGVGTTTTISKLAIVDDNVSFNIPALHVSRNFSSIASSPVATALFQNTSEVAGGSDYQNEVHVILQAGTSADHRRYINFRGYDGSDDYIQGVNAGNQYILFDNSSGVHRLLIQPATSFGHTYISSASTGKIILNGYGSDTTGTGGVAIFSGGVNGGSEIFSFEPTGRLGINNTGPTYPLDVSSDNAGLIARFVSTSTTGFAPGSILLEAGGATSRGQGVFNYNNVSDTSWFSGVPFSVAGAKWVVGYESNSTFSAGVAQLATALFTIQNNGNVGIGNTSPGATLHIGSGTARTIPNGGGTNITPQVINSQTSGTAAISVGVNDGTNNRRAGLFVNNTDGLWGLSSLFDVSNIPFVINFSGTERFRIDTSGNVGIGTTTPKYSLDVSGTTALVRNSAGGTFLMEDTSVADASTPFGYIKTVGGIISIGNANRVVGTGLTTGSSDKLIILASGNVGIGTTSPGAKLQINASTYAGPALNITSSDTDATSKSALITGTHYDTDEEKVGLLGYTSVSTANIVSFGGGSGTVNAANRLSFFTASNTTTLTGTERMRIDEQGNVGISTSTPSQKLDVQGFIVSGNNNTDVTAKYGYYLGKHYTNAEENTAGVLLESTLASTNVYVGGGDASFNAATSLRFHTAANTTTLTGTERMRIDSAGNVGIGTTAPGAKLDVSGSGVNGLSYPNIYISNTSESSAWTAGATVGRLGFYSSDASGTGAGVRGGLELYTENTAGSTYGMRFLTDGGPLSERMRITSTGNVGIGTSTPGTSAAKTFNRVLDVGSETNNDLIGLNLKVLEGTNNRRAGFFLNDATGVYGFDATATTGVPAFVIEAASVERFRILSTGEVGIGTTSPGSPLTVNTSSATVTDIVSIGGRVASEGGSALKLTPSIQAVTSSKTNMYGLNVAPTYVDNLSGLDTTNFMSIKSTAMTGVSGSITNTYGLYVEPNTQGVNNYGAYVGGSVGIGITAPTEALDVVGNIKANGNIYTTGRLGAGVGSLENPSLFMNGDINTGVWMPGSDILHLVTAGTERLSVIANGNVGIGTDIPAERLHVYESSTRNVIQIGTYGAVGSIYSSSDYIFGNNVKPATGTTNGMQIMQSHATLGGRAIRMGAVNGITFHASTGAVTTADAFTSEVVRITNSGFVGIGTTSPSTFLNVKGSSGGVISKFDANASSGYVDIVTSSASSGEAGLRFTGASTNKWFIGSDYVTNSLFFNTGATANTGVVALTLLNTGNVGIGTTAPGAKLDVRTTPTVNGRVAGFYNGGMDIIGEEAVIHIGGSSVGDHYGVEIGATPEVSTPAAQDHAFIVKTNSTSGTAFFTERFRVSSDGNVGIGNTAPSVALDVTGDIEYTGTITDVSDRRLKENIENFDGALEIISSLETKTYNMVGESGTEVGFLAQDVRDLFPGATSIIDPENGYLGVSYVSLVPVISQAVRELNLNLESIALPLDSADNDSFASRFFDNLSGWFSEELATILERISGQDEKILELEARLRELESLLGEDSSVNNSGVDEAPAPDSSGLESASPPAEESTGSPIADPVEEIPAPAEPSTEPEVAPIPEPEPEPEEVPIEPMVEEAGAETAEPELLP